MKRICVFVIAALNLFVLTAKAGHEVGNGNLTVWHCAGEGRLIYANSQSIKLPFTLRIGAVRLEIEIFGPENELIVNRDLPITSQIYNKSTNLVELRSQASVAENSLLKEQVAYVTLTNVGAPDLKSSAGSLEMLMSNKMTFRSETNMDCKNYF